MRCPEKCLISELLVSNPDASIENRTEQAVTRHVDLFAGKQAEVKRLEREHRRLSPFTSITFQQHNLLLLRQRTLFYLYKQDFASHTMGPKSGGRYPGHNGSR